MNKWVKIFGGLLVAVLLATLFAGAVLAQGPSGNSGGTGSGRGGGRGSGRNPGRGVGFVDEDGDGVNDRALADPEFVDEDGDGLCDTHGVEPGEGTGRSRGAGRGRRATGN